ncbi:MAG: LAGLIDADG family homing endonuclease [Candidatus Omnitrophica bacterium]|nr:LAGLIDADG family homing endonuclease [Candidatus Omnitrophota bacterium]
MPQKRKDLKIEGPNLWYLVGLITSDGCLSSDGRHIDITSKDYEFLKEIKDSFRISNKIGVKYNGMKQKSFHIQIANRNFYDFLLSIGLTQRKSLTVGSLNIENQYFVDFLRGLIDGDGSIRRWIHPSNYREQWNLRIYSGSREFIEWLSNAVEQLLRACGKIHKNTTSTWVLKYGKMAAREIVKKCYYKGCLGLARKMKLASECANSYRGWSTSTTLAN